VIRRYTLPEMGAIWTETARFQSMLRVELAVARAQARRGQVPAAALEALERRARVDLERIIEIERTTDHDVIAFVSQVAESVGPEGRYLHLGLTSSDVVDTGLALQLRAAGTRLLEDADRLIAALVARARAEADTRMMGRTHSVHAEPTTMGLKFAGWAFEIDRGRTRLATAVDEIGTGKISGPVGTYSHLGPALEAEVLADLGLHADPVSTQIVQRDRHAALLAAIAILGGSLERIATEVRNLQHTEIGELQEPFKTGQKGSSAMPHKRNPILSERIAGLARLLRGYAHTALEDQPLWHERDISHSSAERVILPDATIVLDYMLVRMTGLIEGLIVRGERMRENIARGLGLHASSRVLVALVEKAGIGREEAYAIVQGAALRAADERVPLRDLIAVDTTVAQKLSLADLDACFDEGVFLRHVHEVIARLDILVPGTPAPASEPGVEAGSAASRTRPASADADPTTPTAAVVPSTEAARAGD
jgi:adenylosuccinate lyase